MNVVGAYLISKQKLVCAQVVGHVEILIVDQNTHKVHSVYGITFMLVVPVTHLTLLRAGGGTLCPPPPPPVSFLKHLIRFKPL